MRQKLFPGYAHPERSKAPEAAAELYALLPIILNRAFTIKF